MGPNWTLEPDDLLALPIDELGIAILRDFNSEGGWNAHNWMNDARRHYSQRPEVAAALSEAWSWLLGRGLVARDFSKSHSDSVFVTRAGHRALEEGLSETRAVERLQVELHPALEDKVRHTYLVGDYDTAVFKAFREIEIHVRRLIGAPDSRIGVSLMQDAFGEDGPLWSATIDRGEQVARIQLFTGAIGLLKNPPSHREVRYEDSTEAAEAILLADLLMRILEHIEEERN